MVVSLGADGIANSDPRREQSEVGPRKCHDIAIFSHFSSPMAFPCDPPEFSGFGCAYSIMVLRAGTAGTMRSMAASSQFARRDFMHVGSAVTSEYLCSRPPQLG